MHALAAATGVLTAALNWDPQLRGFTIVLVAILVLPGSVYLLLATNTGARLGFLLAVAGMSGWCMTMGVIWGVFGIGMVGRSPSWKVQQIVQGTADLANSATNDTVHGQFPKGFQIMSADNPKRGDALAAGDKALVPDTSVTKEGEQAPAPPKFTPPFTNVTDYVVTDVYERQGDPLFTIKHHKFQWKPGFTSLHDPHYLVIQVQPAAKQPDTGAAVAPKPVPDPSKTPVFVVLERDLGSVRFPPVVFALSTGIIFALTCWNLHRRDLEIMAARAGAVPAAA